MRDPSTAPAIVRTLAQSVGMTPIDWIEHPDRIVIIFEQGPKLTFEREKVSPRVEKIEVKEPTPHEEVGSAAPSTAPLPTEGTPFEHPEDIHIDVVPETDSDILFGKKPKKGKAKK